MAMKPFRRTRAPFRPLILIMGLALVVQLGHLPGRNSD